MFVDELKLKVIAGSGGNGCTSFRREKYIPMGGPDGGNGGRGADIIIKTDKSLKTLIDLRYLKTIKGDKGENGKGSNKYGKGQEPVIIKVPMGTTIYDADTNLVIADLIKEDDQVIVAKGGRGGRGNKSFASHDNPAPKFSENGEPGEERSLRLELKMLADVGLVGMPSVGKSTLLSIISSSKPKIAAYHFTTLSPNLGLVKLKNGKSFVMADLPGLIEGASQGIGLGDEFLKHALRTKILAHIVDMGASEGRNPIDDYKIIRKEIEDYSPKLAKKHEIIIASKMDLENALDNLELFKQSYPNKEIYPISCMTNSGIEQLLESLANLVEQTKEDDIFAPDEFEDYVLFQYKEEKPFTITRDEDVWVIHSDKIEKLLKMTKFNEPDGVHRFGRILNKIGVDEELRNLGAHAGDDVQILDFMFTFKG